MLSFYKKALLIISSAVVLTLLLGYIAFQAAFLQESLLPSNQTNSVYHWQSKPYSDTSEGGESTIEVTDHDYSFSFAMNLKDSDKDGNFFALSEMIFVDQSGKQSSVNLTKYDTVTFDAKCGPKNILTFALYTVDESVTTLADPRSHRISTRYFNCGEEWQKHEINLAQLDTPEWWYRFYNSELSKQDFNPEKVVKMSFGSSIQSVMNTRANVSLMNIELHGSDWHYLYIYVVLCIVGWIALSVWLFKQYTKYLLLDVREKVRKDRPLVAYQQLSIEPQKDREKSSLLQLMATEYANPDLHLDTVVQQLGINRNKINEILKDELGFTFSAYLNKLRLNEAARLLSENNSVNVSEIAYSVGYKNVPYFNKLFKNEYGCSPKVFKDACQDKS